MAVIIDATGDQHRRIQHLAGLAHFFVLRIEHVVTINLQFLCAPRLGHLVQLGGRSGHLVGTDPQTAQLFDGSLYSPGRDALHIHLG